MKKIISAVLIIGIIVINFGGFISPKEAMAASLTAMSDTVSNLTTGATASHVIKFTTPTGIPASKTVILTFDNGTSTTGVTASDVTVLDGVSAVTVNAGAPTTTNWGFVNTSSTVLTFTTGTGTIAAGHTITITFNGTNKITNGATGTTNLTINGTMSDSGVISMAIITNGVVAVSASVLGSITFSVSANSISFGTLSAAAPRYANTTTGSASPVTAVTLSAGTNAATGYTVSVQGDTLTGSGHSITPLAASTASSFGNEQFGINLVKGGTGLLGTISSPYGTASQYAYTATTSTPAAIATASGATDINTYAVTYLANISALTSAGSYSTSHTYVATGNF